MQNKMIWVFMHITAVKNVSNYKFSVTRPTKDEILKNNSISEKDVETLFAIGTVQGPFDSRFILYHAQLEN